MKKYLRKNRIVISSLIVIYALMLIWGLSSPQVWDDDCMGRYENAKRALDNPEEFVSRWNRPLFTALFALPLQLGKEMIPVGMGLIAVLTCSLLFSAFREDENSWMLVFFLAFQTFYFPVSINAMSEPLAACLIAAGLYFHKKKGYLCFAIVGGLLPLARLELSILLVLWAVELIRHRKWYYMPILGAGLVIWNFAGTYFYGDWLWLWNTTFGMEHTANRYGVTEFTSYFRRYIYVVGPVIFYFLLLGFRKFDFVTKQFIVGFMIYVFFGYVDMGNSAGFLRHMISIAPLAALIALRGFNWLKDGSGWRLLFSTLLIGLFVNIFLSKTLAMHHILISEYYFWNVLLIFAAGISFIVAKNQWLVIALLVGYTLITEPPDANNNPERDAVTKIAERYVYKTQLPFFKYYKGVTIANHPWFYWIADRDYYGDNRVTMENVENLKSGDILIWDSHYSNRLNGNVPLQHLLVQNMDKYIIKDREIINGRFAIFVLEVK